MFIGRSAVIPVLKFPLVHKQVEHKATNWDSLCGRTIWQGVLSPRASTAARISIPERLPSPNFPWNNYTESRPDQRVGDMAQEKYTAGNVPVCLISPTCIIILHHTL